LKKCLDWLVFITLCLQKQALLNRPLGIGSRERI